MTRERDRAAAQDEEEGASTLAKDHDGYTALEYAAARDEGIEPFYPIPATHTAYSAGLLNHTEVELLILRHRKEELDEMLIDMLHVRSEADFAKAKERLDDHEDAAEKVSEAHVLASHANKEEV